MKDKLFLFGLLSLPFILAGLLLGLVLYAWTLAEFDVKAKEIIIAQKSEEAEIAVEWVDRKGLLGQPVKHKGKKRKAR